MLFMPSGLSAVLDLAIMPVGLLVIGAVLGEDRLDRRRMAAIGMGPAGLMLLFGPQAIGAATGAPGELAGALAVLASSVAYAWARYSRARCCAPFSRRRWLARQWRVVALRWSCLPWRSSTVLRTPCAGPWDTKAWLGWLFLVLFGSLVGYTIYLRLLGEWRPVREGSYAFVSPVVAVLIGVMVLHQHFNLSDGWNRGHARGRGAVRAGCQVNRCIYERERRHERL